MNNTLLISAILDQPGFLEDLVEKLAYRHYDIGYSKAAVPKNWKAIEMSSTETYVSGTVAISEEEEIINMPFITRFLFTCVKEKTDRINWNGALHFRKKFKAMLTILIIGLGVAGCANAIGKKIRSRQPVKS